MSQDINHLKKELLKEKATLEAQLSSVGRKNSDIPGDWEATGADLNIPLADKNEAADAIEEYEERFATEGELESRLKDVTNALEAIEDGSYGKCHVCGNEIEDDRLKANPAARTCKAHRETEE